MNVILPADLQYLLRVQIFEFSFPKKSDKALGDFQVVQCDTSVVGNHVPYLQHTLIW